MDALFRQSRRVYGTMNSTVERVELCSGPLRFSAHVCGVGPTVVFLHGFPDVRETWVHQMQACADAGYRAVAVTARGYEGSSQPDDHDYRVPSMAADVVAWLESLNVEKAHVVGHDWGAVIARAAVAVAPDRFQSLCMMAVPNGTRVAKAMLRSPRQLWLSRYMLFFQLRGVAESRLRANDFASVDKLWRRWSPGWDYDSMLTSRVRKTLSEPGVLGAALAYYRQSLGAVSEDAREAFALAGRPVSVPCLALNGALDGCIDSSVFRSCMPAGDYPKGLALHTLSGVGHFLHLEAPGTVNQILLEWLRSHSG